MREKQAADLYPIVVREFGLPVDKARSLQARVRRGETIIALLPELVSALLDDAQIAADEAWEEIAKIGGFESVADAKGQGYELCSLSSGVIQVRSAEKPPTSEG